MSTVKYHVGLGVFDDDTWFHHNVGLPKLGTTTVPGTGSTNTGFSAWVYSITFTVLIAFTIMIILYVISRASRRKIVN